MSNKCDGLSDKMAEDAAEIFGNAEKDTYLAHSIRDIEFSVLKKYGHLYSIIVQISKDNGREKADVVFSNGGCVIFLPSERKGLYNQSDDTWVRLLLAHEIGHLIRYMDILQSADKLNKKKRSDEDEIYAWKLAHRLILTKSRQLEKDIYYKKHVISLEKLNNVLTSVIKDMKPSIYKELAQSLNLPPRTYI
jgi:hypothetical protein